MPDTYPAGHPPEVATARGCRCQAADLTTAGHPQLAGPPRKEINRGVRRPPGLLDILQRNATLPVQFRFARQNVCLSGTRSENVSALINEIESAVRVPVA